MRHLLTACLACLLMLLGCSQAPEDSSVETQAAPDHLVVMSYNLGGYAMLDRDGDGVAEESKPDEEVDALLSIILTVAPDVLSVQEMGTQADFDRFRKSLADAGLDYSFSELLITPHSPVESGRPEPLPTD